MYFKATFDKSGYTETVFITSEEGFHTYSKICGDAPLTINMEEQTIIVHEKSKRGVDKQPLLCYN